MERRLKNFELEIESEKGEKKKYEKEMEMLRNEKKFANG